MNLNLFNIFLFRQLNPVNSIKFVTKGSKCERKSIKIVIKRRKFGILAALKDIN